MLTTRARSHKILVRIPNREDPDQTAFLKKQSDLGLQCLFRPFSRETSVKKM